MPRGYKDYTKSAFKAGTIAMWYGNVANIPEGWVLCDGNNNTPDLTDRFVVGAGSAYNPHDLGGKDSHTLTIDELPSHNHSYTRYGALPNVIRGPAATGWANTATVTTGATGGGGSHENRPPYHALVYIMKL